MIPPICKKPAVNRKRKTPIKADTHLFLFVVASGVAPSLAGGSLLAAVNDRPLLVIVLALAAIFALALAFQHMRLADRKMFKDVLDELRRDLAERCGTTSGQPKKLP